MYESAISIYLWTLCESWLRSNALFFLIFNAMLTLQQWNSIFSFFSAMVPRTSSNAVYVADWPAGPILASLPMHLPWLDCEGTHLQASSSILKSSVFQVLFQFFKNALEKSSCLHEILHSTTFQFDYERVYNEYQSLAKRGIFLYLNQSSMMQCNFGEILVKEVFWFRCMVEKILKRFQFFYTWFFLFFV